MRLEASPIPHSDELSQLRDELRGQRWTLEEGDGPIIAIALHDGHKVRDDVLAHMVISEADRLLEEDPHTGLWTTIAPNRLIVHHSRFEVDQNRPKDYAIYRTLAESWGLTVWKEGGLPQAVVDQTMRYYHAFYLELHELIERKLQHHPHVFVYDLHSYNNHHGTHVAFEAKTVNPEINMGNQNTLFDHAVYGPLWERIMADLRAFDYRDRSLDVRGNVRFFGEYLPFWIHSHFPERVCAIQFEVKKFFMDAHTGEVDRAQLELLRDAFAATVPGVLEELHKLA